jgi:MazG family protein
MTHKNSLNGLDSLLKIMNSLRGPNGCPWDVAQTPETLTPYILEEACELIDAIETGDNEIIRDELGDLLLQVVFQAQIFNEKRCFDFNDVATTIADKLIRRHPHVFNQPNHDSNESARNEDELNKQWEEIKRSEVNYNKSCLSDHLPKRLPALQRAQKLITKVRRAERYNELPSATETSPQTNRTHLHNTNHRLDEKLLGLELFDLVKQAEAVGLDAETALRKIINQTVQRLDQSEV